MLQGVRVQGPRQVWQKLGRLFKSEGQYPWMVSHASVPVALPIKDDLFRIFITSRDDQNRSHVTWFEMDLKRPGDLLRLAPMPTLPPGSLGHFDEAGAMATSLMYDGTYYRLYYIGWTVGRDVPFHKSIGVAFSKDGKHFEKYKDAPILERNPADPLFVSTPYVIKGKERWLMWYMSGVKWFEGGVGETPWASYNLRVASSCDGLSWIPQGVAIDFFHPNEIAIASPCVRHNGSFFEMWFSYRGTDFGYRIGYATSKDSLIWHRDDTVLEGLDPTPDTWDSEMCAYPHVFEHKGALYMLYAGNGYSKEGIGLAKLISQT